MNTENIPQEESRWELPGYGAVVVNAVTDRGRPPGKQVKFQVPSESGITNGSLGLKKFLKAAKPL